MLYTIVKQVNWVDIFVVIVLFRICYAAVNTGLPIEIFKILGTISAICLSLHYYSFLGGFIQNITGFKSISVGLFNFISFIILAILGYMIFLILRNFISRLVNTETVIGLNRWVGLGLGVIRGLMLSSLIIFMFVVSGSGYLKASVKDSYSGKFIFKIAPAAYKLIWNGAASKIISWEKFNKNVTDVRNGLFQ